MIIAQCHAHGDTAIKLQLVTKVGWGPENKAKLSHLKWFTFGSDDCSSFLASGVSASIVRACRR